MAEIKNFPKPRVSSFISKSGKTYVVGRDSQPPSTRNLPRTPSVDRPANKNINPKRAALKEKIAAESKARTQSIIRGAAKPSVAGRIAGAVGRGVVRAAGPVGALIGMTTPAGAGSDKPSGPLMRGGMQPGYTYKGGVSVPTRGMSGPPKSMPSRPTAPATKSTGPSRGPTSAPVRTAPSKPATSTAKSTGPSRGPTSAPARTQPSKANLGTSRFSKGGSVKRRKN